MKKGDHLAIDGTNVNATYNSSGDKFSYLFAPPLVDGQGARGSTSVTGELLVQAVIEPDADHDGFGDETQDQCPTQANTQGPCDKTPPAHLMAAGRFNVHRQPRAPEGYDGPPGRRQVRATDEQEPHASSLHSLRRAA